MTNTKPHRDTISLEQGEILSHQHFAGEQFVLTVAAPDIAATATAGQFVHIQCSPELAMRRPLSIMQTDPNTGTVTFLYKVLGLGTQHLSKRKVGESISLLGPIGNSFTLSPERKMPLLIGGGVGIPPMVFIADLIQQTNRDSEKPYSPFIIMGSEVPFPFTALDSKHPVSGIDNKICAAMPILEQWQFPSRLASKQGYSGCFNGYVTELATLWLDSLSEQQRQQVEIFSCGPHPMLEAVAKLAHKYQLPCQVSLEEYMACAVGGCAGCVVQVDTPDGVAMKRVCVDGPVFDANQVFPLNSSSA